MENFQKHRYKDDPFHFVEELLRDFLAGEVIRKLYAVVEKAEQSHRVDDGTFP